MKTWLLSHKPLAVGVLAAGLALAVFMVVWFEPQKLVIDETVDEAAPTAPIASAGDAGQAAQATAPAADSPSTSPPAATAAIAPAPAVPAQPQTAPAVPPQPATTAAGSFRSLEHRTTGSASVIELPDGSRTLRLEDFATSNGPDLRVYLSAGSNDAFFGREYGEDFVELGVLKGNIGNQNYAIPEGVDLTRYRNAVIWCKRFAVGFGVATLQ